MTSRDFCFWLQGYFEIEAAAGSRSGQKPISDEMAACIKAHLALVFKHEIDPSMGTPEKQAELDKIHVGDAGPPVPGVTTDVPPWSNQRPPLPGGGLARC